MSNDSNQAGNNSILHSEIDPAQIAVLKELALSGAIDGSIEISLEELSEDFNQDISMISRQLRELDKSGFIQRQTNTQRQAVQILEKGYRCLEREYQTYYYMFENENSIVFEGTVTSGMGEGQHYIKLQGHTEQFQEKLGYSPYPGTLNIELFQESTAQRIELQLLEPINIDSWSDENRTYGEASCYDATIKTRDEEIYEQTHMLVPHRTHHDNDQIELIAPDSLRDQLDLSDGTKVSVHISSDSDNQNII
jgi:riboflavin kinase